MDSNILNIIATHIKELLETNIEDVTVYDTEFSFTSNDQLPAIVIKWDTHTNTRQDLSRNRRDFTFNIKALIPIGNGANSAAQAEREERELVGEIINLLEKDQDLGGNVAWSGLIENGQSLVSQEEQNYRCYSCNLTATIISPPLR